METSTQLDNIPKGYGLTSTIFEDEHLIFNDILDESFLPHKISIPILGITFLSPLNEFLKQAIIEPKVTLMVTGKTGTRKSTLSALFLSFFGNFTNTSLPLSFRDIENSIVEQSFLLKDTLTVIDDFHPSSPQDMVNLNQTMQVILRAYGDRTGRNRLRSDSSLMTGKPPRGNAILTGEFLGNVSESGTARFLVLELMERDVDLNLLSKLQYQAQQGHLQSHIYINIFLIL